MSLIVPSPRLPLLSKSGLQPLKGNRIWAPALNLISRLLLIRPSFRRRYYKLFIILILAQS